MNYISYCRVSTKKQGASGLGIDAQKTSVLNALKEGDRLIAEYQEVESGKNDYRPQLLKAIEHCKKTNSTLLIAKLDRLSRNASFILTLRDSQVLFKSIDMPDANNLTIGIMAILAQDERERISQRTKSALAELKKKGVKLGSPQNLTDSSRKKSLERRQKKSRENSNNLKATAMIKLLIESKYGYEFISNYLNMNGFETSRGCKFTRMSVKRLADRLPANQHL